MIQTITLPISIFKKFTQVSNKLEEFNNEFEDFLLSSDTEFIAKMRRARQNHIQGKTRPLSNLKKELCIK